MSSNYQFVPRAYDKKNRLVWEFFNGEICIAAGKYDFDKEKLDIEFDIMTDEDREAFDEVTSENDFV